MTGLCLGLAGVVWASLPLQQFTLAWQHSIEKIRWEEDYQVTSAGLVLGEARVRGNGAGMEVPDDAVAYGGAWHYRRQMPPLQPLHAGRTPEAGDYEICSASGCQALAYWLGPPHAAQPAVDLWACELPLSSRKRSR
ncbi:hypothetical protein D9M68_563830 [compost metagenome]